MNVVSHPEQPCAFPSLGNGQTGPCIHGCGAEVQTGTVATLPLTSPGRPWRDVRAEAVGRGLVDEEAVARHREQAEQEIAAGRSRMVEEWRCPVCGSALLVVADQARTHIDNCDGPDDEPCVCGTGFTCMATAAASGRTP